MTGNRRSSKSRNQEETATRDLFVVALSPQDWAEDPNYKPNHHHRHTGKIGRTGFHAVG